jgi:hypothetical protein
MFRTSTAVGEATIPDPLLYREELPRLIRLYPLGQPVEIATNSGFIENAVHALWSRFPNIFGDSAIALRIGVSEQDAEISCTRVTTRGQEHLVSMVGGANNFGVADLRRGFGFAWLTRDVAANIPLVISGFLEPLVYLMVSARHFAQVHGACVSLRRQGVILCGESGAGKTCLAYACARAGWRLVSGDAIQIARSSAGSHIVGRPYTLRFRESARLLFPELRSFPASLSLHGKADIEVETADLAIDSELETEASHVVFLNREPGVRAPFLDAVPFEEAFAYMLRVVFYGDEGLRIAQKQSLAEFLQRPVLRLTYSDLNDAERVLRGLVE